jgi:hypothetical protein
LLSTCSMRKKTVKLANALNWNRPVSRVLLLCSRAVVAHVVCDLLVQNPLFHAGAKTFGNTSFPRSADTLTRDQWDSIRVEYARVHALLEQLHSGGSSSRPSSQRITTDNPLDGFEHPNMLPESPVEAKSSPVAASPVSVYRDQGPPSAASGSPIAASPPSSLRSEAEFISSLLPAAAPQISAPANLLVAPPAEPKRRRVRMGMPTSPSSRLDVDDVK